MKNALQPKPSAREAIARHRAAKEAGPNHPPGDLPVAAQPTVTAASRDTADLAGLAKPKAAKPPKSKLPDLKHRCGHAANVQGFIQKDCHECREKAQKAKAEKRLQERPAKAPHVTPMERWPHGSVFTSTWDADLVLHTGTLRLPDGKVLSGSCSGINRLTAELGRMCREYLAWKEGA